MPAKKKTALSRIKLFVLDTNVLMHDPSCLFRFAEHDVFLPMITLEELDGLAGKRQKGPWSAARTPVSAELSSLKRETIERNKDRLERFAACEKRYEKAMDKVVEALKKVSSPNAEVLEAAGEVVGPMAETFLSDLDVLINVMTAKMRDEAKHYHALNVAVLSMMLAKEMGLDKAAIEDVSLDPYARELFLSMADFFVERLN